MLNERSERVKQARKLTRRSGRVKAGRFVAEGAQAVREALASGGAVALDGGDGALRTSGRPQAGSPGAVSDSTGAQLGLVRELFVTPAAAVRHADLVDLAITAGVSVNHADDAALASLSETVAPQGIVAVCDTLAIPLDATIQPGAQLVAVLAEVRDPGNAGTVIRCADAAGADGIVLTHGSVDPLGGKAVRASAGSVFHLPIATDADLAETVTRARAAGLTVMAADGSGAADLDTATASGLLSRPTAWVFGNEAWGMPVATLELADEVVRVPIYGRAESLNLATASAVCLYASARALRR